MLCTVMSVTSFLQLTILVYAFNFSVSRSGMKGRTIFLHFLVACIGTREVYGASHVYGNEWNSCCFVLGLVGVCRDSQNGDECLNRVGPSYS
jgi:hypothetical protein